MATIHPHGAELLNTQFFDKMIKQVTTRSYKFKQAVTIESTSAWDNFFYRRQNTRLTGGTNSPIKGIPPGTAFPKARQDYDRIQTTIQKYGLEEYIPWERLRSSDIDFMKRAMIDLAEGVAKSVDDEIYSQLNESNVATSGAKTINILDYSNHASPKWDETSAAIADNIEQGKELMSDNDYETTKTLMYINNKGARFVKKYLIDKGAQFNAVAEKQIMNGALMNIMGTTFIQTRSVEASSALLVIPKRCGTWKQMEALNTQTEIKKGKGALIWTYEIGVTQLTDPLAVVAYESIFK